MNKLTVTPRASSASWHIVPRKINLDWSNVPLNWIYDDQFGSHFVNALSYFLIEAEFSMCRLCNEALPYITDDKLKSDVEGFIRQEAMHARTHETHLKQYMQRHGIQDIYTSKMAKFTLKKVIGSSPVGVKIPKLLEKQWLMLRAGFFSAGEHYTTAIANYLFEEGKWEDNGCDSVMSDLMHWHAAEEIEHRTVVFDLFTHLGGSLATRRLLMFVFFPMFFTILTGSIAAINYKDPYVASDKKHFWQLGFWRSWRRSSKLANSPSATWLFKHMWLYMKEDYNPVNEGSTEIALEYLAAMNNVSHLSH